MGEVSPETSPNINILVQDKTKLFFQNILQHAKRYCYKLKTNEAKVQYNLASKQYKKNKTVSHHRTLFNRDLIKKLRNLRTKDPKAFWNILSNKRGQEKQNLSLEVFANFFLKAEFGYTQALRRT